MSANKKSVKPKKSIARNRTPAEMQGIIAALNRSQAVIEFDLSGRILDANENFLRTLDYAIEDIRGKHHSMFVEAAARESVEYRQFWEKLGRGEFDAGQYLRIGRDGKQVWIEASYNPILDAKGKPVKVVKFATDITSQKLAAAEAGGVVAAINRSQAVIEFDLSGRILDANENFLRTLGLLHRGHPRQAPQHVCRTGLPGESGIPAVLGETGPRRIST